MHQPSNSQTIRLTVVTETWPPEINGVANTIHKLTTGLLDQGGYQIHLIRPVQNKPACILHPALQETLVPGFSLPFYNELRMGASSYNRLRKLWKKQRPNIVQIVTEGPLGFSAMKAAKSLNIPVFSDFHTNFDQYSQYYHLGAFFKLAKGYLRYLHNQTALTLVPTHSMISELQSEGYQRLGLLARGVDTHLFTPTRRSESLRKSLGVKPDQLLVTLVTRMAKEKNIELAIRTFYAIKKQVPDARFLLVGDGPLRQQLQKKYPDCLFVGAKRGENLARYYASGDLFLYPSRSETFGNVITEAMASGLAVVAFNYAAAEQHIRSGENGWAVPLHNDEAFMQAGINLASALEKCRALGQRAHISAQALGWKNVVSDLDQTIHQLLEEASNETPTTTQYLGNSAVPFFNRINHLKPISLFFAVISRLGNGVFWYVLMLMLPLIYGIAAVPAVAHMMLTGLICLFIYRKLKSTTARARPYHFNTDILQNVAALDQFSFPSGHTLHAMNFTLVLLHYYPEWALLLMPFSILVALSRVVLGLHYPSDVFIGAGLGVAVALGSIELLQYF